MLEINKIFQGEALSILKTLPDQNINCVMTSPPYWALRDYGVEGQLGLEKTFQEYINKLCDIFDEVKRVLRKDGTCWINIGDTYWGGGNNRGSTEENLSEKQFSNRGARGQNQRYWTKDFSDKSLCNIPARFSIEMQNRGWILRNTIIWLKPNCMPSSVKDRFTVNFEYLFFFVKNKNYWFETQYEPYVENSDMAYRKTLRCGRKYGVKRPYEDNQPLSYKTNAAINFQGRNKRAVWTITTKPFKQAHFATFPEELCETPLRAGCPEFVCNKCATPREKIIEIISGKGEGKPYNANRHDGYVMECRNRKSEHNFKGYTDCSCNAGFTSGIVLDPFFGAGTTGLVALKQNKKFIGIELNPEYIKIAQERLKPYLEQTKIN